MSSKQSDLHWVNKIAKFCTRIDTNNNIVKLSNVTNSSLAAEWVGVGKIMTNHY